MSSRRALAAAQKAAEKSGADEEEAGGDKKKQKVRKAQPSPAVKICMAKWFRANPKVGALKVRDAVANGLGRRATENLKKTVKKMTEEEFEEWCEEMRGCKVRRVRRKRARWEAMETGFFYYFFIFKLDFFL